ncbi:ParB/RepB/Spo0J family partition protein [Streptomyces lavendulae]|uniref:ParB/RepB/Spo0J family partition protein n=1 Tax=Streptomyces lavendulae TaxID=1914 RepID=UPI0033DA4D26
MTAAAPHPLKPDNEESPIEFHPNATLFPMLDEDELQALVDDIRELGQHQPVILDGQGRLLDGRNRLRACEILGIEPKFSTYDGDDPAAFALSVNMRRRNLTKGQLAMIAAKASSATETDKRSGSEQSVRSVSEQAGVSIGRIGQANTVLRHAPDLVDTVISGAVGLDEAYKTARENKAHAESAEAQLARLRAEDPELADRVVEGDLTLPGAWAERKARAEEEVRQRKVATQLLCEVIPTLAQTRGTDAFTKFDPQFLLPGRTITRETINHAMTALSEMATTWRERDLP